MKYPSGIKKIKSISNISYKNRGMTLESELNQTNEYYRSINKAYIYKKPTPIKITKVDYPSRDKAVIKEAFFTVPSTTDYNGIYKGKYIDFEAKETKNKTSFPLANIHSHQIEHIKNIYNHNGIVFLIIRFTIINETYLLLGKDFIDFINNNSRKSIPLDFFKKKAYLLKENYNPRIDYLKIIDLVIGGK
ncbi:MAG: Holliday junction resolvase RecU [Bacilli bacterium]|nr:Holliday junction resolvase RecU [Bacilli bacterium]